MDHQTDVGNPWPEPSWFDQPALGRTTINTPHDLQLLRGLNKDKPYIEQIRPGTFLTLAHAHPIEVPGLLIAPYTSDPNEALKTDKWINRGTSRRGFRIRTDRPEYAIDRSVAVLDYRHYAMQYMSHREWKGHLTKDGRLMPRSVVPSQVIRLGKESDPLTASRPLDASTPLSSPMNPRHCSNCEAQLSGRQRKWCSERCRKRFGQRNCQGGDVA